MFVHRADLVDILCWGCNEPLCRIELGVEVAEVTARVPRALLLTARIAPTGRG